jgi:putative transposase
MPRRFRLEFEGAWSRVMTRGNARQDIVQDDGDRIRLLANRERSIRRCDWELFAIVVRSNHRHFLLTTPQPNLAKGMQAFTHG